MQTWRPRRWKTRRSACRFASPPRRTPFVECCGDSETQILPERPRSRRRSDPGRTAQAALYLPCAGLRRRPRTRDRQGRPERWDSNWCLLVASQSSTSLRSADTILGSVVFFLLAFFLLVGGIACQRL